MSTSQSGQQEQSGKRGDSQTSQSYGITFAFATLTAVAVFALFVFKGNIPAMIFSFIYWLGIPLFILIVGFSMGLANQTVICGNISPGPAFFGAIPGPFLALLFMGINNIKFFRVPVASAFQTLLVPHSYSTFKNLGKLSNMNSANNTRLVDIRQGTLEALEAQNPALFGISAAYYIFFAVLFSSVIGNTQNIIC